jgi:outer membrane protein assembly factor BamB
VKIVAAVRALWPAVAVAGLFGLAGCSAPAWLTAREGAEKPAALVDFKPAAVVRVLWAGSVGSAGDSVFFPAVAGDGVYAAAADGQLARFDAASGKQLWRVETGRKLSGGVGAGANLVLVGTVKGEVLAYDGSGKALWKAQLSSEVLSVPQVAEGLVVARTGDGRIFGLDAADGKRRWVYQGSVPALSLRSHAGVVVSHATVFAGFAGGKLVALKLSNGSVVWEAAVAQPRGTTELERIADITSVPVLDEKQVCAVAYQGRVACFELKNGNLIWARDLSSSAGLAMDQRNVFVTDDGGTVLALDKGTGATLWKQDKLAGRRPTAPLLQGERLAVADLQGYVHILSREDGAFVARIATDGSAVRAQPLALNGGFLVQTVNGGLYALSIQ